MALFSWLKQKPAPVPEPEPPREAGVAELSEALAAADGALRVDAARALLDRWRSGDRQAADALSARLDELLDDGEPMVRVAALSASRFLGRPADLERIASAVLARLADRSAQVRTGAVWAAARLPGETARAQVRALLASEEEPMRFAAACALSDARDPAAVPVLTAALRDDHRRQEALSAIMSLGDAGALPGVATLFEDESLGELDRTLAAAALVRLGDPRGAAHLAERVAAGSDDAPIAAEWAGRLGVREATDSLREVSEEEGSAARGAALRALGRLRAGGAEERLLEIASGAGEPEDLRMDAAEGLAEIGTPRCVAALRELSGQGGELGALCDELLAEIAPDPAAGAEE